MYMATITKLLGASLACLLIAGDPLPDQRSSKTRWTVGAGSVPLSESERRDIEDAAATGSIPPKGKFVVIREDSVAVCIPASDPRLVTNGALVDLWASIGTAAESGTLDAMPIPQGSAGQEVRNLFRSGWADLVGLDNPSTRIAVRTSFRLEGGPTQGVFLNPRSESPPAGPVVRDGVGTGEKAISAILQLRHQFAPSLEIFVPAAMEAGDEHSRAVERAKQLATAVFEKSRIDAMTGLDQLFAKLVSKAGLQALDDLVGRNFVFSELPRGAVMRVKQLAPGEFALYQRAKELRLIPYLTFSVNAKGSNGQYSVYSTSLIVRRQPLVTKPLP
jgi:hypothetical protein